MASRFWVGGAGTWDATTTHWSATTGGTAGATVPTAADDVFFDASSGTGIVATSGTSVDVCRSLNFTGYTGTFSHAAATTVTIGDATAGASSVALLMVSGMTYTPGSTTTSAFSFVSTSATQQTITFGGKAPGNLTWSAAGSWIIQGAFNATNSTWTLTSGTLNTNGNTISISAFSSGSSSARTLTLGATTLNLSGAAGAQAVFSASGIGTFTLNANTSTINLTGTATRLNVATYNLTFNNVVLSGAADQSITGGSLTFANLTRTGTAIGTDTTTLAQNITVTGTFTATGNSAVNRLLIKSSVSGTARTVTAAALSITNVDFTDITGAGAGTWSGTSIGDAAGNSGITFTTPVSRFWVGNGGSWNATTHWSATSGGASGATMPLPHDNVTFDANSFSSTAQTITTNSTPRMGKNVSFAAVINTPTLDNSSAPQTVYGNLTMGSIAFNASDSITLGGRGAQTLTTAITLGTLIGIDAPGGTYTLQDNFTSTKNLNMANGTFTVGAHNVTIPAFTTATGTKTLNMGSGAWTVNGTGTVFTGATVTISCETSTLNISDTSTTAKTFAGNAATYNILTISGDNITITGTNTIGTLNINNAGRVTGLLLAANQTITTNVTTNGFASNLAILKSSVNTTARTLTKTSGTISLNYMSIQDSTATGGAAWYAGANSTNVSNNTGWVFTAAPVILTYTQTATARIGAIRTNTQTATARISRVFTRTQTATARIGNINIKTQTARAFIVPPHNIQKSYLYKVYNNGRYLGLLPNVVSDFGYAQDINTAGTQISVKVGVSSDSSNQPSQGALTDESSVNFTDESGNDILTEGAVGIVGTGADTTLIKNGNKLLVYEVSGYYPNGKLMFSGQMQRWEAGFGGDNGEEGVTVVAYSDGQDLDNYLLQGSPFVNDVSSTTHNATYSINQLVGSKGGTTSNFVGQTFTTGSTITNVGAIGVLMEGAAVAASVTLKLWPSVAAANAGTGLLASSNLSVTGVGSTAVESVFAFSSPVTVTSSTQYFFTLEAATGSVIPVDYNSTAPYAGGDMYTKTTFGSYTITPSDTVGSLSDLSFKTYRSAGATTASFSSVDPSTGMLESIIDAYRSQGGVISYNSSTIDPTGLSLSYTFNTAKTYDGLQKALELSPDGFYYYVDVGSNTLYFKNTSTTPDFTITKGKHISGLTVIATIENIKNALYFSGGLVSGANLFKTYQNADSISKYGQRLDLQSDNRVTIAGTADAIGTSFIAENQAEQYQTVVTILDRTMDITLFKPGKTIGFNGFGTFVDRLISQVVRVEYAPEFATLTLGILPPRLNPDFEKVKRGLIAEQTINNPATPS
jgi:hypothetical protein